MLRAIVLALVLAFASQPCAAEWRPDGPVRIIVPFAAGGPSDTVARIVASEMTETLKAPVYVENISGSGGRTGVLRFLEEAKDGHTLLMGHMGTHGTAPALTADLGYDPILDFAPIGLAAGTPMIITVRTGLEVEDLKELEALMRAKGPELRVAHAGRGSVSHAGALLLSSVFKANPTLVAYGGTGPALNDLIGGQVDILVDQIVNIAPAVAAKKAVPLAKVGNERSEALPDVPTTAELGLAIELDAWNALFAKRGTPPDQVATLSATLRDTLRSTRSRTRLLDLGAEVPDDATGTPEALGQLVRNEVARWSATLFEMRY